MSTTKTLGQVMYEAHIPKFNSLGLPRMPWGAITRAYRQRCEITAKAIRDTILSEPPTTEDKPEPKPAEEVTKPSVLNGNWLDEFGGCKLCGGEIPYGHAEYCDLWKMEQKEQDLTARLATAEQEVSRLTELYDTANKGNLILIQQREAAEAQLATLRGELEEAKRCLSISDKRREELHGRIQTLRHELANAAHTWIPVSERLPTEADADEDGFVMKRFRSSHHASDIGVERSYYKNVDDNAGGDITDIHWFGLSDALPKLPTPPESEESRKDMEEVGHVTLTLPEGTHLATVSPEELKTAHRILARWMFENPEYEQLILKRGNGQASQKP